MNDRTTYTLLGVGVAVVAAIYFFGARVFNAVKNINQGTPYEGAGAVGTLGNFTNQLLGGAPQSLGEQLSSWFEPSYDGGEDVFYTVIFPDNARHAIGASTVSSGGMFTYQGVKYRMGINQGGYKVAVRT